MLYWLYHLFIDVFIKYISPKFPPNLFQLFHAHYCECICFSCTPLNTISYNHSLISHFFFPPSTTPPLHKWLIYPSCFFQLLIQPSHLLRCLSNLPVPSSFLSIPITFSCCSSTLLIASSCLSTLLIPFTSNSLLSLLPFIVKLTLHKERK